MRWWRRNVSAWLRALTYPVATAFGAITQGLKSLPRLTYTSLAVKPQLNAGRLVFVPVRQYFPRPCTISSVHCLNADACSQQNHQCCKYYSSHYFLLVYYTIANRSFHNHHISNMRKTTYNKTVSTDFHQVKSQIGYRLLQLSVRPEKENDIKYSHGLYKSSLIPGAPLLPLLVPPEPLEPVR